MKGAIVAGAALAMMALSLTACRSPPAGTPAPQPPAAAPAVSALTPPVGTQYVLDASQSQVLVLVYRDGAMARLGHNHVIAIHQLSGSISLAPDSKQSSFRMDFPVAEMSVDEPGLRAAEGEEFQTTLDEAAIAGTRDHMLGESLLDARQYPQIRLRSGLIRADADSLMADTAISLRAATAHAQIPIHLRIAGDDLIATGEFDLTHAQLGLTPYSVGLGALRVAERIHIKFRLIAHRADI
jgi:polyisoprenoid-binding protein YceI